MNAPSSPRTARGTLGRVSAAILVGVVAFAAVGLGVTAVLDSYVWPSLFVGIPVGGVVGAVAAVLAYRTLARREARTHREKPEAS